MTRSHPQGPLPQARLGKNRIDPSRVCLPYCRLGRSALTPDSDEYAAYYAYYSELRTLGKDAPIHRAIQHVGRIAAVPVLGGLHCRYCRI